MYPMAQSWPGWNLFKRRIELLAGPAECFGFCPNFHQFSPTCQLSAVEAVSSLVFFWHIDVIDVTMDCYVLLCITAVCLFLLPIGAVRVARSAENSDLTRTTRHQWPCRTAVRHCLPLSGPDFHTLHRGLWNSMSSHETSWNYSETFPIFETCVCYVIYCYGIVMIMCIIYPLRQETSVIHRVIRRRWSTTGAVCRIWETTYDSLSFVVIHCHSFCRVHLLRY